MKIIGLSGKKCVGKDTVADIIVEELKTKYSVFKVGFADALYREVAMLLLTAEGHSSYTLIEHKINDIKANKSLYRVLLQWWGTDYRRFFNNTYWIEKFLATINNRSANSIIVVPDVRFKNEYDVLKELNADLWEIERYPNKNDPHISENDLSSSDIKWDHHIYNEYSLVYLKHAVIHHLNEMNL
jgi:hypothetical protein